MKTLSWPCSIGLVVFILATSSVSTHAQSTGGSDPTTAAITSLAQYTAQGAAKEVGGELASWGMSSLGFPSTDSTAELEKLLAEVVEELDEIRGLIADLDCIENASSARSAASRIQSAWNTYQISVQDSYIDSITLESWKEYVRGSGTNSLTADIVEIANDFTGLGTGVSILSSCESANNVSPPQKDKLGDTDAWSFSAGIIDYYASNLIVGIAILVDDAHLQAFDLWQEEDEANTIDSVATDDLPVVICGDPPENSPRAGACKSAATFYTSYRNYVVNVLTYGGAPYSSEEQFILNGRGLLFIPDLRELSLAGGYASTCANASTATGACGAGVGPATSTTFLTVDGDEPVQYGGWGAYSPAWHVADNDDWGVLFKKYNSGVLRDWMISRGFVSEGIANKVFYTGATLSKSDKIEKYFLDGQAIMRMYEYACFVSTETKQDSYHPFCNHDGFYESLAIDLNHTSDGSSNACATVKAKSGNYIDEANNSPATDSDGLIKHFIKGGQYQMAESCDKGKHVRGWEDPIDPTSGPGVAPGWLTLYKFQLTSTKGWGPFDSGEVTSSNAQYHFPVFDLDDYYAANDPGCTTAWTNMNNTGTLPSICGTLLDAYVDSYIPPLPVGSPPTLEVPAEQQSVLVTREHVPGGAHNSVTEYVDYEALLSAMDEEDGELLADCVPKPRQPLQLGVTRVRCKVVDADGNVSQDTFEVHVKYPFQFEKDLAANDYGVVRHKAGKNLELAFSMAGYKGLDVLTELPTLTPLNCDTGEVKGEPFSLGGVRHGKLKYSNKRDRYTQVFRTQRDWKKDCHMLSLSLVDDSVKSVVIRFR